jgi:hypothetical protein
MLHRYGRAGVARALEWDFGLRHSQWPSTRIETASKPQLGTSDPGTHPTERGLVRLHSRVPVSGKPASAILQDRLCGRLNDAHLPGAWNLPKSAVRDHAIWVAEAPSVGEVETFCGRTPLPLRTYAASRSWTAKLALRRGLEQNAGSPSGGFGSCLSSVETSSQAHRNGRPASRCCPTAPRSTD